MEREIIITNSFYLTKEPLDAYRRKLRQRFK